MMWICVRVNLLVFIHLCVYVCAGECVWVGMCVSVCADVFHHVSIYVCHFLNVFVCLPLHDWLEL